MNMKVMTAAEREAQMRRGMRGNFERLGSGIIRMGNKSKSNTPKLNPGMKTALSGKFGRTEIQSPQRPQVRFYRPKKDDGIGEAMSPGQRANFIKGKNKGYNIRTTPAGATYGVRKIT